MNLRKLLLSTAAIFGSCVLSAQLILPAEVGFESADEGFTLGNLHGQQGWLVDQGVAEVADETAQSGFQSVRLNANDPFTQISVPLANTFAQPVIFVDAWFKPYASDPSFQEEFLDVGSSLIGFFEVEPGMGQFFVRDGISWRPAGEPMALKADGSTTRWVRLTLRQSYTPGEREWDLYIDGCPAAMGMRFFDPSVAFPDLFVQMGFAGSTADTYMDTLHLGFENPLFADADRDGMSDDFEATINSDPFLDDRDVDSSGNGMTNLEEYALTCYPEDLPNDPIAYWPFDDQNPTEAYDLYAGFPPFTSGFGDIRYTTRFGNPALDLSFEQGQTQQQYLQGPNDELLEIRGDITVGFWINLNSRPSGSTLAMITGYLANDGGIDEQENLNGLYTIGVRPSGKLWYLHEGNDGAGNVGVNEIIDFNQYALATNTWYYVAVVRDSLLKRVSALIYDDAGNLLVRDDGNRNYVFDPTGGEDSILVVGATTGAANLPFPAIDGLLDELRIYDRKLTDEETILLPELGRPPVIIKHPESVITVPGATVTFSAVATGNPSPTLQWFKDSSPLTGETDSVLTLEGVTAADLGNYDLVATNPLGTATSNIATLSFAQAPLFLTDPTSLTVFVGESATFQVSVAGFPPPTLQWFKDGVELSGETGLTFTIDSAELDDAGSYHVTAANDFGDATSGTATLTVLEPDLNEAPVVDLPETLSGEVAVELAIDATVTDDGNPNGTLTYQWTQVSGPGTASFANPTAEDTGVTFDLFGTYVLRLTADDSALTGYDEVTVNVGPGTISVYLIAGQSNAAGQTPIASFDSAELSSVNNRSDILIYDLASDSIQEILVSGSGGNQQQPLIQSADRSKAGPEGFFAQALADHHGQTVAIIKYARSGSAMTSPTSFGAWDSTLPNDLYASFLNSGITQGLDALVDLDGVPGNRRIVVRGLLWVQGESDADVDVPERLGAYEGSTRDLFAKLREDVALLAADPNVELGTTTLPIAVVRNWDTGYEFNPARFEDRWDDIRRLQTHLADEDPLVGWIDTDASDPALAPDSIHYGPDGVALIAEQGAATLAHLQSGHEPVVLNGSDEVITRYSLDAVESSTQSFTFDADDLDGDAITWHVEPDADFGPILGSVNLIPGTGNMVTVEYTSPASGFATDMFRVVASDGTNDSSAPRLGTAGVLVTATEVDNRPPYFVNFAPLLEIDLSSTYSYTFEGRDLDTDDTLTFHLGEDTPGTLDPDTGEFTWTPGTYGDQLITVTVRDNHGAEETRDYVISVEGTGPEFITTPNPLVSDPAVSYAYDSEAADLEGDPISYELLEGPVGMVIDRDTGKLDWTPGYEQVGSHTVVIRATDIEGKIATQTYIVDVTSPNRAPRFTSFPVTNGVAGVSYTYPSVGYDPDADPLTYGLVVDESPAGMSLNTSTGVITWTPPSAGTYPVQITVEDGRGGLAVQEFTIDVTASTPGNGAPVFVSTPVSEFNLATIENNPNLIQNGSFETFTGPPFSSFVSVYAGSDYLDSWVIEGDIQHMHGGYWEAAEGDYSVDLMEAGTQGRISQTIPTNPGDEYVVSFDLSDNPDDGHWGAPMVVEAAGQSGEFNHPEYNTWAAMDYTRHTWRFVAEETTTTVSFSSKYVGEFGPALDNVSVRKAANADFIGLSAGDGECVIKTLDVQLPDVQLTAPPVDIVGIIDTSGSMSWEIPLMSQFYLDLHDGLVAAGLENVEYHVMSFKNHNHTVHNDGGLGVDHITASNLAAELEAKGGAETGAYAMYGALNDLQFRPGSTKLFLLITDDQDFSDLYEYRWGIYIDRHVVLPMLQAAGVTVHGILYESFRVEEEAYLDTVLDPFHYNHMFGVSGLGSGSSAWYYDADSPTGFTRFDDVTPYRLDLWPNIWNDYGELILETGGIVWDILTFRNGVWHAPFSVVRPIFTRAVAEGMAQDALSAVLSVHVRSTDPSNPVTNLSGVLDGDPNETVFVDVEICGASTATTFAIELYNPKNGFIYDTVPVALNQLYFYPAKAIDPEGDELTYGFVDGSETHGATIDPVTGQIEWMPAGPGSYDFSIIVTDTAGGSDIQDFTVVVNGTENTAPEFISEPPLVAEPGADYKYQVIATDQDGHAVNYSLVNAPNTMSITEEGRVTWTPSVLDADQSFDVEVRITDIMGASATQAFSVTVSEVPTNFPPIFDESDIPVRELLVGQVFSWTAVATDPDTPVENLIYEVRAGPEGMEFNGDNITWAPTENDAGLHRVIFRVRDGEGGADFYTYELTVIGTSVNDGEPNSDPVFDSTITIPGAYVDVPYELDVTATDPDGHNLYYQFEGGIFPVGATIDSATGRIEWTPDALGSGTFRVSASDGMGGKVIADFTVPVSAPASFPPTINNLPEQYAEFGSEYFFQVDAVDPEGGPLTFWLKGEIPTGMTVSNEGLITWTPSSSDVGEIFEPTLVVSDEDGMMRELTYQLAVTDNSENSAPIITSSPENPTLVNQAYRYDVAATDPDNDSLVFTLVSGPAGMVIDADLGVLTWTPSVDQIGRHPVVVRVSDTRESSSTQSFTLIVTGNEPGPQVFSDPRVIAYLFEPYTYQPVTSETGARDLVFELFQWPAGMTIHPFTGRITWTPQSSGVFQVGYQVSEAPNAAITLDAFSDELVGYFPFAQDETDASGRENPVAVSLQGNSTVQTESLGMSPNFTGVLDSGAPGASSGLILADHPDLNSSAEYAARTVSFWFKIDDVAGEATLFQSEGLDDTGTFSSGIAITYDGTSGVSVRVHNEAGAAYDFTVDTAAEGVFIAPDRWNHLAVVLDATASPTTLEPGAWSFYLNGSEFGATQAASARALGQHVSGDAAGSTVVGQPDDLNGTVVQLDELTIWNRALVPNEITQLNRGNGTSQTYSLVVPKPEVQLEDDLTATVDLSWGEPVIAPENFAMGDTVTVSIPVVVTPSVPAELESVEVSASAGDTLILTRTIDLTVADPVLTFEYSPSSAKEDIVVVLDPANADENDKVQELRESNNKIVVSLTSDEYFVAQGSSDTEAPQISLQASNLSPQVIRSNITIDSVTFTVSATDNEALREDSLWLKVDGVYLDLDESGQAQIEIRKAGPIEVVATVYDDAGNYAEERLTLNATIDGSKGTLPVAEILTPEQDDIEVTRSLTITGSALEEANSPRNHDFGYYTLSYLDKATGTEVEFHRGQRYVNNSELGVFDATTLPNGIYDIILTVYDKFGNYSKDSVTVVVTGALKLGALDYRSMDVSLSTSGLPLSIERVYSSMDKSKGPWGTGWQMEISTVRLSENRRAGDGWKRSHYGFFQFGMEPSGTREHIVTIDIPGMRTQKFRLQGETYNGRNVFLTAQPFDGTTTKLEIMDAPSSNDVFLAGTTLQDFSNGGGGEPLDFDVYRLVSPSGEWFIYDQNEGRVTQMGDRLGNVLYIEDDYIYSEGFALDFVLDEEDRITEIKEITNGLGRTWKYSYDEHGNLASFTNALGAKWSYIYDRENRLVEVIDPTGKVFQKTDFDSEGRLKQVGFGEGVTPAKYAYDLDSEDPSKEFTDSFGNRIEYTYNDEGLITQIRTYREADGQYYDAFYEYNEFGSITKHTAEDGTSVWITYHEDADGNPLAAEKRREWIAPTGELVGEEFTYDSDYRLLSEKDALGRVTTYRYNDSGLRTHVIDSENEIVSETVYNDSGDVLRQYDGERNMVEFLYYDSGTAKGMLHKVISPRGNTTEMIYDDALRPVATKDPRGGISRMTYNDEDVVVAQTDALGNTTRFAYNHATQRTSVVDPVGNEMRYKYNFTGDLSQIIGPDDVVLRRIEYSAGGEPNRYIDALGRVKRIELDENNQELATFVAPSVGAAETQLSERVYDLQGRLFSSSDVDGNTVYYEYDAMSNLVRIRDHNGDLHLERIYDKALRIVAEKNGEGELTAYQYDHRDRVTRTYLPDETPSIYFDGPFIEIAYDGNDRVIKATDPVGNVTENEYDSEGNLVAVAKYLDGARLETRYYYDESGNLIREVDAEGRETLTTYDLMNRRIREVRGDYERSFVYDDAGRLIREIYGDSDNPAEIIYVSYDEQSRPYQYSYYSSDTVKTYRYYDDGSVREIEDQDGIMRFTYDPLGNLASVERPDGLVISYTMNAIGRVEKVTTPAGEVSYTFNDRGLLETITDVDGRIHSYQYDLANRLESLTYGNGAKSEYTYTPRGQLSTLTHLSPSGAVLESQAFDYRADSMIRGRTYTGGINDGVEYAYEYDDLVRLTREERIGANAYVTEFDYDRTGNRTRVITGGQTTEYSYNSAGQLVESHVNGSLASRFRYDSGNRMLEKEVGLHTGDSVTHFYEWLDGTQLASVEKVAGGSAIERTLYGYDALSNLTSVTPSEGDAVNYLHDYSQSNPTVVGEFDKDLNLTRSFVHAGQPLLQRTASGEVEYFLRDRMGSVSGTMAHGASTITDPKTYQAYGSVYGPASGGKTLPFSFTGHQYDSHSGLHYMRARWYDQDLGQFLMRDPYEGSLMNPISRQFHPYANSNPVNFVDPDGRFPINTSEQNVVATGKNILMKVGNGLGRAKQFLDRVRWARHLLIVIPAYVAVFWDCLAWFSNWKTPHEIAKTGTSSLAFTVGTSSVFKKSDKKYPDVELEFGHKTPDLVWRKKERRQSGNVYKISKMTLKFKTELTWKFSWSPVGAFSGAVEKKIFEFVKMWKGMKDPTSKLKITGTVMDAMGIAMDLVGGIEVGVSQPGDIGVRGIGGHVYFGANLGAKNKGENRAPAFGTAVKTPRVKIGYARGNR